MEVLCVSLVAKIVETLVPSRQFQYLFFYKKNIEILESELQMLKYLRHDVEERVHIAERNLDIIAPAVEIWLKHVEEIERQSEEILGNDIADPAGVKCLNLKFRYMLSKKARKTVGVVRHLCEERSFELIAYRPQPLGIIAEVHKSSKMCPASTIIASSGGSKCPIPSTQLTKPQCQTINVNGNGKQSRITNNRKYFY